MNEWMMMAMMFGMANRSNAADTVQTVLGASSALGEGGRMAFGLMRQQQVESERTLARKAADERVKALGHEVHTLIHELRDRHRVEVDVAKYPAIDKAIQLALPGHGKGGSQPGGGTPGGTSPVQGNGQGTTTVPRGGDVVWNRSGLDAYVDDGSGGSSPLTGPVQVTISPGSRIIITREHHDAIGAPPIPAEVVQAEAPPPTEPARKSAK